ncbi:ABC transporter permease [Leeuwenhoekiella sp. UBA1003]|uniref:ABC transporter permease n=1 Tax=Leeuwenhoekiella sp. UBA1003 TaxID=1946744 RepID=UPI0025C512AA|nr:ABC transporter permease [Leeuwenhoekiella sp. UBA1003]
MKSHLPHIDIKKFLPHRDPMLFVHHLMDISEEKAMTSFTISEDTLFVEKGSFSEVGLIENAAQSCSAIIGQDFFDDDDYQGERNKVIGYISAIKKIEIHALPKVGQEITTRAQLVNRMQTEAFAVSTVNCTVHHRETLLLEGTLNFIIHEV